MYIYLNWPFARSKIFLFTVQLNPNMWKNDTHSKIACNLKLLNQLILLFLFINKMSFSYV